MTPALEKKILGWDDEAGDGEGGESLECYFKEEKELNTHLTPHWERSL